jgi:tetratricopeptide (TPR) repeat protein
MRSHRAAIRLLESLADAPLAADEDRAALASELEELARILGPERDETLPMHVRALAIRRAILERDPSSPGARRGLAISHSALADFHLGRKDWATAVEVRQKERGLFKDVAHDPAATDNDRRNLALSNKTLGALFEMTGRRTESLALYREALALDEARAAANPASPEPQMDLSFSLGSLGAVLLEEGDLPASRDLYERALRLREAVAAADPANAWARNGVARAHERLAVIEERLGHRAAAEAHRLKARPPAA